MFETRVDIAAAPEDIWAVLVDVERWPQWTDSMSEVRLLGEGPLAVGTRVRIKQPRLPPTVWEVTSMEPLHSFSWTAAAAGMTTVADHRVTSTSTASGPVTVTLTIRRSGALAPLVDLVLGGVTRRYVSMEAEGLKRRCEQPP